MERPDLEAQRRSKLKRLKVGFILLIAASAGLIASFAEATLMEILAAILSGLLVGLVLQWVVIPSAE